jgi:predicted RNase H-like HicB family nuclease
VRRHTVETEIIFEVEEAPEGGYDARALGYSIYTQAETIDELKAMLQDAVRCHFEENERPLVIRLHLVKDEVIAV